MTEEKGSFATAPRRDVPHSAGKKGARAHRKVRILLRQVAVWLDNWGLRGYPHDTHDWASKVERFRSIKNTSRHMH